MSLNRTIVQKLNSYPRGLARGADPCFANCASLPYSTVKESEVECCMLPEVPITVTVYVPAGVELPVREAGAIAPHEANNNVAAITASVRRHPLARLRSSLAPNRNIPNSPKPELRDNAANKG